MKNYIYLIICLFFAFCSSYSTTERDTNTDIGFVFMGVQEETNQVIDLFIPITKFDKKKSIFDNFIIQNRGYSFPINIEKNRRLELLSKSEAFYNDLFEVNHKLPLNDFQRQAVGTINLLPIKISYYSVINDSFRIDTSFVFNKRDVKFSLFPYRRIRLIKIDELK